MRIIEVSKLYGSNNEIYIEIIFADVTESERRDTFMVPYLQVISSKEITLGKNKNEARHFKKGNLITQYQEDLQNPVASFVFHADSINKEQAQNAIALIFERG